MCRVVAGKAMKIPTSVFVLFLPEVLCTYTVIKTCYSGKYKIIIHISLFLQWIHNPLNWTQVRLVIIVPMAIVLKTGKYNVSQGFGRRGSDMKMQV